MLPPKQRQFHWEPITSPKPIQVNDPDRGRYYISPEGVEMESVTTFLGRIGDKSHLERWKARLGEEEAERQRTAAADRGTKFHAAMEAYLQQSEGWKNQCLQDQLWRQCKPVVDQCLGTIYAQELGLFSNLLRLAGTMDLCAEWKGKLSIVDWKGSTNIKKFEYVVGYFMQTCIYSLMLQERTGLKAEQLVIVIGTEKASKPTVFVEDRKDWVPIVMDAVRNAGLISIPEKDTKWPTSTSTDSTQATSGS